MEPVLSLQNVSLSYLQNRRGIHSLKDFILKAEFINPFEKKQVLQGVSFNLNKGESLGIMGRNGSGKSTLLKAVAGILKPEAGTVTVRAEISPLLALGAGIELELTGYENIKITLAMAGQFSKRQFREKLKAIMEFSELGHEELRLPAKAYSSGMLSRLAFSTVMSFQPEMLLIDEVLAVGDKGFQNKCLDRMQQIIDDGATILFVSHNPDELRKICTRGICLDQGRVIAEGNIEKAISAYNRLFE